VGYYSGVLYVAFCVIGFILFCLQILFLQRLTLMPAYLLPLLSFCVTYENAVMYYSCNATAADGNTIGAGLVFIALIPPLILVLLYEISYRLYEARQAHFFCLPLEQGLSSAPGAASVWLVRLVAAGLFIMAIFVNFSVVSHTDASSAGSGGYAYLAQHSQSLAVWLALIPPIVASLMALCMGIAVHRYGKYNALGLVNRWKIFWLAVFGLVAGYCFDANVFPVTSNAGELAMLLGLTGLLWLVQEDLDLAAGFADFLRTSNLCFGMQGLTPQQTAVMVRRMEEELELQEREGRDALELVVSAAAAAASTAAAGTSGTTGALGVDLGAESSKG
jgi:hypothetical protein